MRPVPDAFLNTLRGSHRIVHSATVCTTFQTGTDPTGVDIPITGGDVKLDGTANIRSTLDMGTVGLGMWPRSANALLAPYGNEIYIKRGVVLSDEQQVIVGLGYFRIQSSEQEDTPDGEIRLSGRDRMAAIIEARLLAPIQFEAGTPLGTIVSTLVTEVYPAAVIEWDDATDTTVIVRSLIATEDRFAFLDDLFKSVGKIWYWDHRGILIIRTPPDPSAPVWEVSAGARGVLVALSRALSRDTVYNAVVASGEGTDTQTPVRGVAIDDHPLSPTYFYGRFGQVPRFYSSSFLATDEQATAAAATMLRSQLGLSYSIDFRAVPNPALEPWDAVTIRAGVGEGREVHVIDSLTIPLTTDAISATTRDQSVVLVGTA